MEVGPRGGLGGHSSWHRVVLVGGRCRFPDLVVLSCSFCLASGRRPVILHRTMSQHRSLRGQGAIKAKRNVLKRFERVEVLKKRGQFKDGQSVIGLKKTKPDE